MKKIIIPVISAVLLTTGAIAQTNKTKRVTVTKDVNKNDNDGKTHIKTVTVENGKTVVFDTVLVNPTEAELKKYGIELPELPEVPEVPAVPEVPGTIPKTPTSPSPHMKMKKIVIKNDGSNLDTIIVLDLKDLKDLENITDLHDIVVPCPPGTHAKVMKRIVIKDEGNGQDTLIINETINAADIEKDLKEMGIEIKEGDGKGRSVVVIKDENITNDGKGETKVMKIVVKKVEIQDPSAEERKAQSKNLGAENNLKADQLNFYPNPNNGKFTLSFNLKEKGNTTISVFNAEGKKVYNENLKDFSGEYSKAIDLTGSPKGIYFLNVTQEKNNLVKKIVIE